MFLKKPSRVWRTGRLKRKGRRGSRRGTQRISSAYLCDVLCAPLRFESARKKNKTRENGNRLRVLHGAYELRQRILRVAIKHAGVRLEEQGILETGKTFALPAL